MRTFARAGILVLAAAAFFGASGACRESGPPASAVGAKSKPLTLAVIPMGTTHEFWKAIHAGALTAARELGVQDPFAMGYKSVRTAVAHLRGEPYDKNIDTGVFLATPENMDDPKIRRLLAPDLSILDK
jgi:ABC-type sugar transport system substrate-binding protein